MLVFGGGDVLRIGLSERDQVMVRLWAQLVDPTLDKEVGAVREDAIENCVGWFTNCSILCCPVTSNSFSKGCGYPAGPSLRIIRYPAGPCQRGPSG